MTNLPNIPDHRIEEELGRGGMGVVYLATHTAMGSKRAVKVMSSSLDSMDGFKDIFQNEGQIIARLNHPNIVQIHDMKVTDTICYMSMEYLDGGTLKDKLKNQPLSAQESLFVLQQVGAGLNHAHNNQYIHCDIKPANILFNREGVVKLADFGIAQLQDISGELTLIGFGAGAPLYMSPEQRNNFQLDKRSDIYSLGLVFYEMLTAQRARGSDTNTATIFPDSDAPMLPPQYQHYQLTLNKALAKKPEGRYDSVLEFIHELINATRSSLPPPDGGHETIPPRPDPDTPGIWKKALVTIVSFLVLTSGGWYVYQNPGLLDTLATKLFPLEKGEDVANTEPQLESREQVKVVDEPSKPTSTPSPAPNLKQLLEDDPLILFE